ncbi:MAG TPA: ATP-dependent helicase [Candidatus Cloacimonetes bacterium]|nr:ATP-dependent helicase [Candidatus Cloacimonadota bacterium]
MGRLFGLEYHEHSNSWFFKSSILNLNIDEIKYKKFLDENKNIVFQFEAGKIQKKYFPNKIEIIYNQDQNRILSHHCSECGAEICRHYLSIINYAYKYLSTDILMRNVIQTYQNRLLEYNEYWQRIVINANIEIADIFSNNTDKIRFYLKSYLPLEVRLISILLANREFKNEDIPEIPKAEKQAKALSESEVKLFSMLQINKCSYSRKGTFFTIYKKDFVKFFPVLKNLRKKVFIKETGDNLQFSEENLRLNFSIQKNNDDNYIIKPASNEFISAAFIGKTSYIFKKNIVYPINLPFKESVTSRIFDEGFPFKKADLVYFSSIVARQLGLSNCYLDFTDDIEIPKVYHNTPVITFKLHKEDHKIIMDGILDYGNEVEIPLSAIRFPVELVRFDQKNEIAWFYIPPQIKYQIFRFVEKLPDAQTDKLEENSQLIFEGEENIEFLKKIIFEHSDPSWKIILADDLKNEFVYKVKLQPIIRTKKSNRINWFEYEVEYKFKDIRFTHSELKKFFKTKAKFMKMEDGRLLFFDDKKTFEEVDKLLKRSKKLPSEGYKLSVYNLPYIYQISSVYEGIKIEGDDFLEEMFSAIIRRKLDENSILPFFLKPIMRSYQKAGFRWLKMLQHYHLSGILADEMGLGKTIQSISILSDLPQNSRSLVICPKTLLFNWGAEIRKFNRNLTFIIYEGNQNERKAILDNLNVNVMLASYSIIQNDIDNLAEIEFDYLILDEAQHIKNAYALRTKAIKKLKSKHKLALSGTPVENNPTELWSIFDFLMSGYFPSLRSFKNEFASQPGKRTETYEKLKLMISPFILRRKKKEVLIELPDKQEQVAYCKLSPLQEKMYLQIIESVKKKYLVKNEDIGQNYMHILAALTRLRQICNHPALLDNSIKDRLEFSAKTELLHEIISDAVESGKKLLVFSQFVGMLKILQKMIKKMRIPFEYMDGSTKNRQKIIENFNNNNNIKIFLVSLKTGGFGLNLVAADTVIIVDPWWNPMGENQAIDRAHRIGQTKKVMVYKIISKGTIEEKILDLQLNKREMFESLIDQGQSVIKKMSSEQLRELLEY